MKFVFVFKVKERYSFGNYAQPWEQIPYTKLYVTITKTINLKLQRVLTWEKFYETIPAKYFDHTALAKAIGETFSLIEMVKYYANEAADALMDADDSMSSGDAVEIGHFTLAGMAGAAYGEGI